MALHRLRPVVIACAAALIGCSGPAAAPPDQRTVARPTVQLRVKVSDRIIEKGQAIPLTVGQSAQLAVELVRPDGRVTDVTSDRRTRYLPVTTGIVSVSQTGLVSGTASGDEAVAIVYGEEGDAEVGATSVVFEIAPPPGRGDGLEMTASQTTLRVGETAQLRVFERLAGRPGRDLTSSVTGTVYTTTDEAMLIPEPDGRVTCIGTRGRPRESAIVAATNGKLYRSLTFDLIAEGPGPRLEVHADRTVLAEGASTRLHVVKIEDGRRQDVTAASTGTRYLTFAGEGRPDTAVVTIDGTGVASATTSIGRLNRRRVTVFARNGDAVGWLELQVVPTDAK
jgi:hypothetical protein